MHACLQPANEPLPSFGFAAHLRVLAVVARPRQKERIKSLKNSNFSSVIITVELDSSEYRVGEEDGKVTVCVQTEVGLPEPVDIQLRVFELLEELNNATGNLKIACK